MSFKKWSVERNSESMEIMNNIISLIYLVNILFLFLDDDRVLSIKKKEGDTSFGFHIKGTKPISISTVESGQ